MKFSTKSRYALRLMAELARYAPGSTVSLKEILSLIHILHGICASTGSACNSDSLDPSHVLLSIGVPEEIGHGSMRFTFGPQNTMEEAKYLCDVLEEVIPRRRGGSL